MNTMPVWPDTKLTSLLHITLPLIQAPMSGGATTPEMVAAVSNAGGMGSLGAGYMSPEAIRTAIKKIRELTANPFTVNLFIPNEHHATEEQIKQSVKAIQACCPELNFTVPLTPPPYAQSFDQQMAVLLEEHVPVFSFTFGLPSAKWIALCKENKITLLGTATTLEEAQYLQANHIDAVIAQGSEAGGHRGTFLGSVETSLHSTFALTALLTEHINLPVIASGGIMEAKGIVTALTQGAQAVQMGSAFLCCKESGIHPLYKKILLTSSSDTTTLTRVFSGRYARGITNTFIQRMQAHANDVLDYPIQNALTSTMRKEAAQQNNTDFMSLWAGQSAFLCKELSAAELVKELNNDVIALLNKKI